MKRILILIFAGIAAMTSCNRSKDQADAWGTFESDEVTVSSMANGKLLRFTVEEGQQLDSGQMVGFVDTTDLWLKKKQALQQRSATGSRASDLDAQVAVQEQNKANLLVDKRRIENLLKDGAATQKQLDDINSALNLADRQIALVKSQYAGIGNQVGSVTEQIAQLEESIRNSYIINPVAGTVLTKFAEQDEVATFGKPLYKIADIRVITLRVYVSGAQLPHIRLGQQVDVFYDRDESTNTKTSGTVTWISESAEFTPKTIQTKEERVNLVYAVKIRVRNDGSMKIGMPGEIRFMNK
jgi:HlyD family secretion protein